MMKKGDGEARMDPRTALTVALISFVGVLVGGFITTGTNFVLAMWRQKADDVREERVHRNETCRSARLIYMELQQAKQHIDIAIKEQRWLRNIQANLSVFECWNNYRSMIALDLSLDEWEGLSTIYNMLTIAFGTFEANPDAFGDPGIEMLKQIASGMPKALDVLHRLSGSHELVN
jgi:hypothetical protein